MNLAKHLSPYMLHIGTCLTLTLYLIPKLVSDEVIITTDNLFNVINQASSVSVLGRHVTTVLLIPRRLNIRINAHVFVCQFYKDKIITISLVSADIAV